MLNNRQEEIKSFPYVFKNWKYFRDSEYLPDPRMIIARQMAWSASWDNRPSDWVGLEPDDYTHGICHTKPLDLPFVKDQCFFYEAKLDVWFSMYYIEEKNVNLFNRELIRTQPRALWSSPRRSTTPARTKKTLIQRDMSRPNCKTAVATERLAQMGYFRVLQDKYFIGNEDYLLTKVGTARATTDDLDFEVEEDFYDEA